MQEFNNYINKHFSESLSSLGERLPNLIMAILIILVFVIIARIVSSKLGKQVSQRSEDPLLGNFITKLSRIILLLVGLILALQQAGMGRLATGIWGTAGIGAFIIGFAFKDIGEHFLAGFILAIKRPFRVGDTVELAGEKGVVVALEIRTTHIKTFDGKDIFIPNGNVIKNSLLNYTIDGFIRHEFDIHLRHENNTEQAIASIIASLSSVDGVLTEAKTPAVVIRQIGLNSIHLIAYYWIDTFDKELSVFKIRNETISKTFTQLKKEKIDLAIYPHPTFIS